MTVPDIALHDGTTIPQLGFGVFQVPPEDTAATVATALEAGYRHIDTAQMYGNEAGVGEAIKASGIARDELYVTTKLNNSFHLPDDARREIDASLDKLGLDQVDLFLIHWPLPNKYGGDFVQTWRALIEAQEAGKTRSIGVSNFQPAHLERIVSETGVVPVVNQVEVHPFFANEDVRSANAKHGVLTEAWSPIAQGKVMDDDTIGEIASLVGRTPAQVALRWHVQRGDIIFPKSMNADRMKQNFEIFDFELEPTHMSALDELDRGEAGRMGPNPDTF
ncbi:2,5-diketo-D-gluconate reductase A [Nocardioides exalbidus]|uniref:2,5-diketo-D-gluconate reductase A n=1 Tax=Nocardioides exalbidus TaxID=402596 RepID=A0A1H4MAN0_9ACTN|nr:aldo/keto reductase [Nocardioides exalbidus]SEB79887.1 2,5-diketo-D-gluconate reductase A [Nocardioides exalbidus]